MSERHCLSIRNTGKNFAQGIDQPAETLWGCHIRLRLVNFAIVTFASAFKRLNIEAF
jgi:hypothetical protein